jgi:ethanolamine utilization protein EutQ (cupin superfamily)
MIRKSRGTDWSWSLLGRRDMVIIVLEAEVEIEIEGLNIVADAGINLCIQLIFLEFLIFFL